MSQRNVNKRNANKRTKPHNGRRFFCRKCPWVERSANCVDRRLLDGARSSDLKKVQDALADGARLAAKDEDGKTVMDLANNSNNTELKEYLQRRVLMDSVETLNGGHLSGRVRKVELSELEMTDVARCPEGRLLVAAKNGDLDGVKAALAEGADLNVKGDDGKDAIALAKEANIHDVVVHLRVLKLQKS